MSKAYAGKSVSAITSLHRAWSLLLYAGHGLQFIISKCELAFG